MGQKVVQNSRNLLGERRYFLLTQVGVVNIRLDCEPRRKMMSCGFWCRYECVEQDGIVTRRIGNGQSNSTSHNRGHGKWVDRHDRRGYCLRKRLWTCSSLSNFSKTLQQCCLRVCWSKGKLMFRELMGTTSSWSHDMEGHAKKCVENIVNWQSKHPNSETKSLLHALTTTNARKKNWDLLENVSKVCSQICLKCLYLARIVRPDISWSVNKLARAITKWTRAWPGSWVPQQAAGGGPRERPEPACVQTPWFGLAHAGEEGRINVLPWSRLVGVVSTSSETQGGKFGLPARVSGRHVVRG